MRSHSRLLLRTALAVCGALALHLVTVPAEARRLAGEPTAFVNVRVDRHQVG